MATENPYRYAGYRYDEDTKLYYLMARYYNSDNGVFMSLDSVRGDLQNPDLNGYNYANNKPVMYVDPNGHFPYKLTSGWISFGLAVAALLGAPAWLGGVATAIGFAILFYDLYYVMRHKYSFRKAVNYIGLDIWNAGGKIKGQEHLVTFGFGHASLIMDTVKYWIKRLNLR